MCYYGVNNRNFLEVVSSAIVDKYIGECARLICGMFNYACDHQPFINIHGRKRCYR